MHERINRSIATIEEFIEHSDNAFHTVIMEEEEVVE
jgi:hypothetical protein